LDKPPINTLTDLRYRIYEFFFTERDARKVIEAFCLLGEQILPHTVASVMCLDDNGLLQVYAAPSIPAEAKRRLANLHPGLESGSCGNVIVQNQPVFVEDTLNDSRWKQLKPLAADFNMMSCWSVPVRDVHGRVMGTFALSSRVHRMPTDEQRDVLETIAAAIGKVWVRDALDEAARSQASALNALSEGVLITDAHRKTVFVNAEFTRLTGYTLDDLLGKKFCQLQGAETSVETQAAIRAALQNGTCFQGEILNYRHDGTPFWNRLSISPVFNPTGQITHYVGVQHDISARKRLDVQLHNLQQYQSAVLRIQQALMSLDEPQAMYQYLVEAIVTDTSLRSAFVAVPENDTEWLKVVAVGARQADVRDALAHLTLSHSGTYEPYASMPPSRAFRENLPVGPEELNGNPARSLILAAHPALAGLNVAMAFPVVMATQVTPVAVLVVYANALSDFTVEIQKLLAQLVQFLGLALMRVFQHMTLQANAARIERLSAFRLLLAEANQAIADATQESSFLQQLCDLAVQFTSAKLVCFARPDAQGQFYFPAASGAVGYLDGLKISIDPALKEGQGGMGRVWREDQAIYAASYSEPYLALWRERASAAGLTATTCLPVHREGKIWGLLSLFYGEENLYDDELKATLQNLVDDVSHGLDMLAIRSVQNALLNSSVVGIILLRQRVIQGCNAYYAKMLGYASAEDLRGRDTRLFFTSTAEFERFGEQHDILREQGSTHVSAQKFMRQDGTVMLVDMSGTLLSGADDNLTVWTIEDVTARERTRQLYQALLAQSDVVLQSRGEADMLASTCTQLAQNNIFHAVWISQPDAQGAISVLAQAGAGASALQHFTNLTLTDVPLVAQAWAEHKIAYNHDNLADPRMAAWHSYLRAQGWLSSLAIPVWRGDQPWAVIDFVADHAEAFDSETQQLCQRVADFLGHGLDELDRKHVLSTLQTEEAYRARHDSLTGLPNRFALENYLPQALARMRRADKLLAVGLLDLDDFKPVNDQYGHEAGDQLLREFAQRMRTDVRESDFIARLGGDEFVVVLEDLDALQIGTDIAVSMNRLHQSVESPFTLDSGAQVMVGMTIGLALFPHDAQEADTLLRQADAAMYQNKLRKLQRTQWWQLGVGNMTAAPPQELPKQGQLFDPFGAAATDLLNKLQDHLHGVTSQFVERFYAELNPQAQNILKTLSETEMQALKIHQFEHVCFLLNPRTTREMITARAQHLGVVHSLVGINGAALLEAGTRYRQLVNEHFLTVPLRTQDRYYLTQTIDARIQHDTQIELQASDATQLAYQQLLMRTSTPGNLPWLELQQLELQAIADLPGVRVCEVLRPDVQGVFMVEASAGSGAEIYREAVRAIPPVLDEHQVAGQGLVATAWRSRHIMTSEAFAEDQKTSPWHESLRALSIRSMVTIPVVDMHGITRFILGIQGSYPNQFSTHWARQFTLGLQQRWFALWRQANQPLTMTLPQEMVAMYRKQLFSGGLLMLVQPIVNLHTGALVKVEALARLKLPDGEVVLPNVFLPLLSSVELNQLFRLGLDQALSILNALEGQGVLVGVSVNLPPGTLLDGHCVQWVETALRHHGIAPQRLTLELLETDRIEHTTQDEHFMQLRQLGVGMSMDDLGSGFSSLQRLSQTRFTSIKMDQSLLAKIYLHPIQTLSLLSIIVQMGRDFDCEVVIEGLENADLIETATLMGASYGQGYGLAYPMLAQDLLAWQQNFKLAYIPDRIQTSIGALAYHWKRIHDKTLQLQSYADCPLTRFLAARHLQDSVDWHEHVHADPQNREASQALLNCLVDLVQKDAKTDGKVLGARK
jgi:diguanylate cyclase (GGDEF)-like protein/PAS domain S-box-containing protein